MLALLSALFFSQSAQILTDAGPASAKDKDPDVVAARMVAVEPCGAVRIEVRGAASDAIASYVGAHGWRIEDKSPTYIFVRFGRHANEDEIVDFFRRLRLGQFGSAGSPTVIGRRNGKDCPRSSAFTADRV